MHVQFHAKHSQIILLLLMDNGFLQLIRQVWNSEDSDITGAGYCSISRLQATGTTTYRSSSVTDMFKV